MTQVDVADSELFPRSVAVGPLLAEHIIQRGLKADGSTSVRSKLQNLLYISEKQLNLEI